jgi:DNA-binding transcriptional regulator YiaG
MAKKKQVLKRKIAGRTYSVEIPVRMADDGELVVDGTVAANADLAIAAAIAGSGPVLGETFAWMRRAAGIQAKTLAELLDVRAESVSRWERGERPMDRAAWLLLADIILERAGKRLPVLELMKRIASISALPKQVNVQMIGAAR